MTVQVTDSQPRAANTTRISIEIPSSLLSEYESQAKREGVSVDTYLATRLSACRTHNDGRALYFTDSDRQLLETLLDSSVGTPSDALKRIRTAMLITVDNEEIVLYPKLVERLKGRAVRVEYKRFIKETVLKQLEHYVGLR